MLSKNDGGKRMEEVKSWHARLEETRELWRNHMKTWQESGLSQAAYCRQHQIKGHKFLYWKKRLLRKPASSVSPTFAELPIGKIFGKPTRSTLGPIRIEVRGGYQIAIEKGFDPQTLLELIRVLDSTCSG